MTPGARVAALCAVGAVAIVIALIRRESVTPAREHAPRVDEPIASAPTLPESVASPVAASTARPPAEASHRPETEDEFMRELMQLESTDKQAALTLALKGEAWYSGSGKPAEARRAMIVTLLADLGRMDEARARAREFMALFPGSEYLPLVQGATGIHPRPHGPSGVVY